MRKPLAGVRVLDLSRVLAGPFAAMTLGDLGAEVIKVEEPRDGDPTRGFPPFWNGESCYYLSANRNKRGLTLNLSATGGAAIVRRLVARVRRPDRELPDRRDGALGARLGRAARP